MQTKHAAAVVAEAAAAKQLALVAAEAAKQLALVAEAEAEAVLLP